jgi:hypothetical protein
LPLRGRGGEWGGLNIGESELRQISLQSNEVLKVSVSFTIKGCFILVVIVAREMKWIDQGAAYGWRLSASRSCQNGVSKLPYYTRSSLIIDFRSSSKGQSRGQCDEGSSISVRPETYRRNLIGVHRH